MASSTPVVVETLVCKNSSLETANTIRQALVQEFSGCWFYLYNNGEIWVANDFGGRLNDKLAEEVAAFAREIQGKKAS